MPRISRATSNSKIHHVIVQGINKEYIFNNEKNILYYKKIILKLLKLSNITILSYCIMNNHAHLLIYCEKIEYLSKFMQRLNTSYSQYYNKQYNRVGYVFRDRYLSQDILDQKQLFICLKYIHNNPLKANMVKNIADYKYSSYREFLGKKQIITNKSLNLLFGKTNNYIEHFKLIHNQSITENFFDILDIKDLNIDIDEFTNIFKTKYKKSISEITKDKLILKNFINQARDTNCITIRDIAKKLNISKSKVDYYINRK